MRFLAVVAAFAFLLLLGEPARAEDCGKQDNAELCKIAQETRADNPAFGRPEQWNNSAEVEREKRHAKRRARARTILVAIADPTWRDLSNAGYTIAYGNAPEERLTALGIAIRALSLAPNEPSVRLLVAMTTDGIARNYVGAQLYGRQKFFKLNPETGEVESYCLPQMLIPALPPSVGEAFDAAPKEFKPCPQGVGEIPLAPPIAKRD